jgi:hypothetical protein
LPQDRGHQAGATVTKGKGTSAQGSSITQKGSRTTMADYFAKTFKSASMRELAQRAIKDAK